MSFQRVATPAEGIVGTSLPSMKDYRKQTLWDIRTVSNGVIPPIRRPLNCKESVVKLEDDAKLSAINCFKKKSKLCKIHYPTVFQQYFFIPKSEVKLQKSRSEENLSCLSWA